MELENEIWSTLSGGYKIAYDASVALRQLSLANDTESAKEIFDDLWENLHHQGDVGLASYLAVTKLVEICIAKKSLDWNFIGLCLVIENCRQLGQNPELPTEYNDLYLNSLNTLQKYLLANFENINDPTSLRLTLGFLATVNGQPDLGKAIENLDKDVIDEFISQF